MSDEEWEPGDPIYPDQRPSNMCRKCGIKWQTNAVSKCPRCGTANSAALRTQSPWVSAGEIMAHAPDGQVKVVGDSDAEHS